MPRRGANEGSIYRRSDGRWAGAISVGHRDGKRVRKVVYAPTRHEVSSKLRALIRAADDGLRVDLDRQTISQFLPAWLESDVRPRLRPKTIQTYETVVRVHLLPTLGRIAVAKLSVRDVQGLLNAKSAGGLSPRTVRMLRDILRQALNVAMRWGMVGRNVAALANAPKAAAIRRRILLPTEARRFVEALGEDRLAAVFLIALTVGLRQGEILGLSWEDVDLENGALRVRRALSRAGGVSRLVEPKTERSVRTVVIGPSLVAALRSARVRQREDRLLAGSRWVDGDLLFTTSIGTPLDGSSVTKRLHGILSEHELPQITFHDLRHSCASLMLAQGIAPRVVMETLGHSDIRLTMNLYTHVIPELQRDAADRMEKLLGG